jgi:hypothetical protein
MTNRSRIGIGGLSCPWDDEELVYRYALPNKETYPSSADSRRKVFVGILTKGA